MKKLVFGALVSALSLSSFAVNHPMHSAHQDLRVGIWSRGTDVKFMECDGTADDFVVPGHDGTNMERRVGGYGVPADLVSYVASLNSLHYGESFTFCTAFKLTGGYEALRNAGYKIRLETGLNLVNGSSTTYLTKSGLQVRATSFCKHPANYNISTGWNHLTDVIPAGVAVAPTMAGTAFISGLTGYPESCEIHFTFTETSVDQRENTTGESINLDLDLDAFID